MTQTTVKLMTFDEYLNFDDGTDTHYELEDGLLREMPPESPENNHLARLLLFELAKHFPTALLAHKDTEVEVSGRRAKCRLPDLLVHTEESLTALKGASRATLTREMPPPALVVEVVSPGAANRSRDYRHKRTEYAARGIPEYWIIDPEERRVTVCQWVDGAYEDRVFEGEQPIQSVIVPQFQLSPTQLFIV